MTKFLIGQRVIYQDVICKVCAPPAGKNVFDYWIYNTKTGYEHGVAIYNLKPLPDGQL